MIPNNTYPGPKQRHESSPAGACLARARDDRDGCDNCDFWLDTAAAGAPREGCDDCDNWLDSSARGVARPCYDNCDHRLDTAATSPFCEGYNHFDECDDELCAPAASVPSCARASNGRKQSPCSKKRACTSEQFSISAFDSVQACLLLAVSWKGECQLSCSPLPVSTSRFILLACTKKCILNLYEKRMLGALESLLT